MFITPVQDRITPNTNLNKVNFKAYNNRTGYYDEYEEQLDEGKRRFFSDAFYDRSGDVKKWIMMGVDVNSQQQDGSTALHIACANLNVNTVRTLLEQPYIDINIQDKNKKTPLMYYLENCETRARIDITYEIFHMLMKRPDLNLNLQDKDGNTAFMIGMKENVESGLLVDMLKRPNIDLTLKNFYNRTAVECLDQSRYKELLMGKVLEMTNQQLKEKYSDGPLYFISDGKLVTDSRHSSLYWQNEAGGVDINKLSPEENIYTEEKVTESFLNLVRANKYDDAAKMLEKTPLIDFDSDNGKFTLKLIGRSGNIEFMEKVFDYKLNKQPQMRKEYDAKRKDFLENKIRTLSYGGLKDNSISLYTTDGFRILMNKEEFDPNDLIQERESLFEIACEIDPEGNLAKEILSKYDNVFTNNLKNTTNKKLKNLINEYETIGKYKLKLEKIKRGIMKPESRDVAVEQIKDLIRSEELNSGVVDEIGNNMLHIIVGIPSGEIRGLIQKLIGKGFDINSKNISGRTPLMSAIRALTGAKDEDDKTNILSNIKFLLDKGANINDKDTNGQTALHYACCTTSIALLTLLLSREPNLLAKDLKGLKASNYLRTSEMKEAYNRIVNG